MSKKEIAEHFGLDEEQLTEIEESEESERFEDGFSDSVITLVKEE